jgi:hypothetical protein
MYHSKLTRGAIATIMALTLCFAPAMAYAQEAGAIVDIKKDDPAPYDGVLFDKNAAARLLADKEYNQIECNLKINFQNEKIKAKHALELGTLQASFEALKGQNISLLEIKDAEILRLQELALKNPNDNSHWWMAGGVITGIVTSIAIFYAAVEIER